MQEFCKVEVALLTSDFALEISFPGPCMVKSNLQRYPNNLRPKMNGADYKLELGLGFPGLCCCYSVVVWNKYLKEKSSFLEHANDVD